MTDHQLTRPQAALRRLADSLGFTTGTNLYTGPRIGARGQVLGEREHAPAVVGILPAPLTEDLPTGAVRAFHCRWWSDGIVSLAWRIGQTHPEVGGLKTLTALLRTEHTTPRQAVNAWQGHEPVAVQLQGRYVADEAA